MSQLSRKFIEDNAVNGTKFRLDNNEMLRARNAANSGDINIARLTSADIWEYQVLPQAASALPVPSALKQFATVEYIQNFLNSKGDPKDSVAVLSDVNVPLTGSTPLVIDGITVTDQLRIGLTGQTTGSQNGIYIATITGPTYSLARSADANTSSAVTSGMFFNVVQGTVYAGWEALLTTADPITLDTTTLTFVLQATTAALVAGDMLIRTGNVWAVDLASAGGLESTNPGNAAGQLRIKVDTASLEKDRTTRIDGSNALVARRSKKTLFTLAAGDITNQYVDLVDVAGDSSVKLSVVGAGYQAETIDFTVNYTGGVGSKTRVTFAGGLGTSGASALAAGDQIVVEYTAI